MERKFRKVVLFPFPKKNQYNCTGNTHFHGIRCGETFPNINQVIKCGPCNWESFKARYPDYQRLNEQATEADNGCYHRAIPQYCPFCAYQAAYMKGGWWDLIGSETEEEEIEEKTSFPISKEHQPHKHSERKKAHKVVNYSDKNLPNYQDLQSKKVNEPAEMISPLHGEAGPSRKRSSMPSYTPPGRRRHESQLSNSVKEDPEIKQRRYDRFDHEKDTTEMKDRKLRFQRHQEEQDGRADGVYHDLLSNSWKYNN